MNAGTGQPDASPGALTALSYLRVPPAEPVVRRQLLLAVVATPGGLEALLLGLVDEADDVALTNMTTSSWNAWLDEHLAVEAEAGVTPGAYAGHKRALTLLRLHDGPRAARLRLTAAVADEEPAVGVVAAERLADFIDRVHAGDRPAWERRLDERLTALMDRTPTGSPASAAVTHPTPKEL